MKKHFWFGRELTDEQLETEVSSRLDWAIPKTDFMCEEVIRVIGEWSKGLSLSLDHTFKKELISFCSEEELRAKVIKELGSFEKLKMRRVDFSGNYFERRSPLGVVTHILPGNSEGLSFLACIESLLVGNINIIKLSQAESDISIQLAKDLIDFDDSGVIKERIAFLRLSSGSKILDKILSLSQGVSAWGGDSALSAIRSKISPQVAFIPWGHKISFSLVASGEMNESQFAALAHDVIDLNQQACSSPQVIFYECNSEDELKEFAELLLPYLASASKEKGPLTLTQQERAEIQNEGMVYQFMDSQQEGFFIESEDVRVLGKMKFELSPSPLNRTVHLRPINREVLVETLLPWREYLQTCGLCSSEKTEFLEWSKLLLDAGINRVCLPGKMVESYSGEPHDGQYALERLSKVVRVELENGKLNTTLFGRSPKAKSENSELMDKEAFQNQSDNGKAQFYFKSGGSSGTPKISRFTYQDYHSQMLAASDGLIAAGLNPIQDRVVNLFFGGGLYGGFLSFTTILEKVGIAQLPMGAIEDFSFLSSQIISLKVNTLFGMPSYILQYLEDQQEELKHYGGIEKIFYGGEHFSKGQRQWITDTFNISFIKSASYGSVDAGPIGHQCVNSENGVHHLNDQLQSLKIVKIDSLEPVVGDEVGRMIVSTPSREAMKVLNYDIGDLGRWVKGKCPCGSQSPRFELLGRTGDIFRAAGNFLNYKKFESLLEEAGFQGEFQLIISNSGSKDDLEMRYVAPESHVHLDSMFFVNEIKELREAVLDEGVLGFKISKCQSSDLIRVKSSGKLRRVIDQREYE